MTDQTLDDTLLLEAELDGSDENHNRAGFSESGKSGESTGTESAFDRLMRSLNANVDQDDVDENKTSLIDWDAVADPFHDIRDDDLEASLSKLNLAIAMDDRSFEQDPPFSNLHDEVQDAILRNRAEQGEPLSLNPLGLEAPDHKLNQIALMLQAGQMQIRRTALGALPLILPEKPARSAGMSNLYDAAALATPRGKLQTQPSVHPLPQALVREAPIALPDTSVAGAVSVTEAVDDVAFDDISPEPDGVDEPTEPVVDYAGSLDMAPGADDLIAGTADQQADTDTEEQRLDPANDWVDIDFDNNEPFVLPESTIRPAKAQPSKAVIEPATPTTEEPAELAEPSFIEPSGFSAEAFDEDEEYNVPDVAEKSNISAPPSANEQPTPDQLRIKPALDVIDTRQTKRQQAIAAKEQRRQEKQQARLFARDRARRRSEAKAADKAAMQQARADALARSKAGKAANINIRPAQRKSNIGTFGVAAVLLTILCSGVGLIVFNDHPLLAQFNKQLTDLRSAENLSAAQAQPQRLDAPPPIDLPAELEALRVSAVGGNRQAQHDLGAHFAAGRLVNQDFSRAAYWFQEAAIRGVANAQYNFGVLLQQGLGVDPNPELAVQWYERAAENGHVEAQYNMGVAYADGIGTPRDIARAVRWFEQSAAAGIARAAFNLGVMYEVGMLGQQDIDAAKQWYRQAATSGDQDAISALERLNR